MFASAVERPAWCLLTITAIFFVSCVFSGFWFSELNPRIHDDDYPESITAIFSTQTIDALNQDRQLHEALLSLTTAVALSSTDLGDRYGWENLRSFGGNLTSGVEHFRNKQVETEGKRGLIEDIGKGIGSALSSKLNVTGGIQGVLSGLGNNLVGALGTPALFLGIGLGMGASTGLNLTSPQQASAIASRIATSFNAAPTGLNLVAQNLGDGLLSQILPTVKLGNAQLPNIGPAAFALASGIGNATAAGLGLTQEQFKPAQNATIEDIAGNIGLGITTPLVANLKDMLQSLTSSAAGSGLMQKLPEIASAAGVGLGKGVKNGLGLGATKTDSNGNNTQGRNRRATDDKSGGPDISQAVELFTEGASQSFLAGSNFSLANNLFGGASLAGSFDIKSMLAPIASGVGAGIGLWAAVGLNFRPVGSKATIAGDGTANGTNGVQVATAAEAFTQNLLTNFLLNSSVIDDVKMIAKGKNPMFRLNFEAAQAAEGFGRGAIEGVVSAISSVGGFKNLVSGDIPANAIDDLPVLGAITFNDSVNGAAVGLGRGITGKGTLLVANIVKNLTSGSQTSKNAALGRKRSISSGHEGVSVDKLSPLYTRQTQQTGSVEAPLAIDAATAQAGGQKAVDVLNCQGIGGLASVFLGVRSNLKPDMSIFSLAGGANGPPLDPQVLQALPKGPVNITLNGNTFEIVLQDQDVKVNGQELKVFVVLTALHVLFVTLAFFLFLPLYLIWGVVWRFSNLVGYPVDEARNRNWRMGFLLAFALFSIVGIVLGIVGIGNVRHFRDLHAILGLVALIIIVPAVGLSIVRLRTSMPHPAPSAFVGFKGPIGLARSPQRVYFISSALIQIIIILGQLCLIRGFETLRSFSLCAVDAVLNSAVVAGLMSFLLMVQISATALVGIRTWLEQRIADKEKKGVAPTLDPSVFGDPRNNTMERFGFDQKKAAPAVDVAGARTLSRRTDELQGTEDRSISTPYNLKKDGSFSGPSSNENALVSPRSGAKSEEGGFYTPKTGNYTPTSAQNGESASRGRMGGEQRPSSGAFNRSLSPGPRITSRPKTANVTTQDLFPPPRPESERPGRAVATEQAGSNKRNSRPIDGNIAVRNSLTGFEV